MEKIRVQVYKEWKYIQSRYSHYIYMDIRYIYD